MIGVEDGMMVLATPLTLMLGLAAWRDISRHRIDNWITFTGAALALGIHFLQGGLAGLGVALAGLAVGLAALLPFYAWGGMAAGDIKLMAAAGAFLGPVGALLAAAFSLMTGSLMALGVLAQRRGLRQGLAHIGRQLAACGMTGVWITAPPDTPAAQRFPYAIAIACGCLAAAGWNWLGA
jgi:prepilin peptidase CpaA